MFYRLFISALMTAILCACMTAPKEVTLSPELAALDNRLASESPTGANFRSSKVYREIKSDFTSEDLRRLSDRGNSMASVILGTYLKYEGDYAGSGAAFLKACDAGNALGCRLLGGLYHRGSGVEKDIKTAFQLWTKSCDIGNYFGCNDLGTLYDKGQYVEEDNIKAETLFRYSCDGGMKWGCSNLEKVQREIARQADK